MKTNQERKNPNKYDGMSYEELLREIPKASQGEEARMIHRALKKYGDGLHMMYRYPNFPIYFSLFSGAFAAVAVFIAFVSM